MAVAFSIPEKRALDAPEEDDCLAYPFLFQDGLSVIEFVCYANSFRSPICERIARNHIKSLGLDDIYIAVSSGTNVADLVKGHPYDFKVKVVEAGIKRGFYTNYEKRNIEEAIVGFFPEVVDQYFERSYEIFEDEEKMWKPEVLKELGIKGKLKTHHDQVIPVRDRLAVFTMSEEGLRNVSGLYDQAGFRPGVLDVLPRYATGVDTATIHNSFGRTKDEYRMTVHDLMRYVPMALDKILHKTNP